MASNGYKKSSKAELVAIYRLEFYKNKKKWKFCNEKAREKAPVTCEPPQAESNIALDKTYNVEQNCSSDKEKTSPLNNAFIHEIPYDTPSPDVEEPPPPPPPPTPQSTDDVWPDPAPEHTSQQFQRDVWTKHGVLTGTQPLKNTQAYEWPNRPPSHLPQVHEAPWTNQAQPVVTNLQWSNKTPDGQQNPWQSTPSGLQSQGIFTGRLQPNIQKTQADQVPVLNGPELPPEWPKEPAEGTPALFYPATWTNPPPTVSSLQDKALLANLPKVQGQNDWNRPDGPLLPQGPPANSLQMLLCPDKWKKPAMINSSTDQDPKISNLDDWTKPPPPLPTGYKMDTNIWTGQSQTDSPKKTHPICWTNQPPVSIPTQLRKNPDVFINQQSNPPKIPANTWTNQIPNSWTPARLPPLMTPADNPEKPVLDPKTKGLTTPEKISPDVWTSLQKGPVWNNPALLLNVEGLQQNIWTNQAWQKQQDLWQNKEQGFVEPSREDVPDGVADDEGGPADPDAQYSAGDAMDQCTLKLQHSAVSCSVQSPEHVRENTDEWLRRLLALYRDEDVEPLCEQYQGQDTSLEFIREAHGVPHSSENDPTETDECICPYISVESLPGMSTQRLSSAILHATRTLRDVLREQLLRDRLRSRRVINVEEYPTRDTDVFGCEYILSGSHVPRSTGDLGRGPERVIKIDMGRPYRL